VSDLPTSVTINEEGPREGFQIEPGPIATADKIRLIDALAGTGLRQIQCCSFVNPKRVPGMADADAVARGIERREDVHYTGLWLNEQGLMRAIGNGCLDLLGTVSQTASPPFLKSNQNTTPEENAARQDRTVKLYLEHGIPVERGSIMAAFGCNFMGEVPHARVLDCVDTILRIGAENGVEIPWISLNDTMGWATPVSVKRLIGAVRDRHPDLTLALHLHDTRGLGLANAMAGLEMGVRIFDASVAGLGGCPFAGHKGAAGNVCTEDLVFMCHEMGIETGVDLEALIDCALMAERIVGHDLPGRVMKGGALSALRREIAA